MISKVVASWEVESDDGSRISASSKNTGGKDGGNTKVGDGAAVVSGESGAPLLFCFHSGMAAVAGCDGLGMGSKRLRGSQVMTEGGEH